jgi:hypothetical protein
LDVQIGSASSNGCSGITVDEVDVFSGPEHSVDNSIEKSADAIHLLANIDQVVVKVAVSKDKYKEIVAYV